MTREEAGISVVICTYAGDRWADLVVAVESVQQQTLKPLEVIIVVDHNPSLLRHAQTHLSGVVVTENHEQRGLSGARNSGVRMAHGALVAFLDDDAVAAPDWLARLSSWLVNPQVLGAGGRVDPVWLEGWPAWFPEEFAWVIGCTYRGLPLEPGPIRNLYGGCMCIRKEIIEGLGGFRTGIGRIGNRPLGCEETELCIRARQRWPQSVFIYDPYAGIEHRIPASRAQWKYFCSRCYAEGLSKALLSRSIGVRDGLSSELAYTFRTLPTGVIRGVWDTLLRGDSAGLSRGGAILAGLVITAMGYLVGLVSIPKAHLRP